MAMRKFALRKIRRNPEAGMTMLEVLIAGVVMTIGFMGLIGLVATAIASNNRNKLDSTGTMLTQAVLEQVNSVIVGVGTATIADCGTHGSSNPWPVGTAAGGAPLTGANIDFSQATVANYQMDFVVCTTAQQSTYDVRWNVAQVSSESYLVTVGARLKGTGSG